jgi:PAS domain S-box-containing protein
LALDMPLFTRPARLGMGARLLLAFVALIALLALFSIWSYQRSRDERRAASLEETVQSAQTVAALVQGLLRDLDSTTLAMSQALAIQEQPLNQETVGPYLATVVQRYSFVRSVFLMDPAGRVIASPRPDGVGVDLSSRPYTQALLGGADFTLSNVLSAMETGTPIITMGRTVRGPDGGLRALLAVAFYPDRLTEILPGALPADATVTVFDRGGGLVYSSALPEQPFEQRDLGLRRWVPSALAGQITRVRRVVSPADGNERFGALVPVPDYGWAVASSRTAAAIEAPLKSFYRRQLLGLGLMTAIALVLALMLSRTLALPLVRLAEEARALGRGGRTAVTPVQAPREVRVLAESLNQMAAEVEARFAEREAAENALREQEEHLRFTLKAANVGTWEWDIRTDAVRWSENLAPIFGLTPGTFGGTFDAFVALVHPDDRDAVTGAINRVVRVGGDYDIEFRVVPPDGACRWISGRGRVFHDDDGVAVRMVGLGSDITARKQAEEQLREEKLISDTLNRIGSTLAAELDRENVVQAVTDAATVLCGARFGAFFDVVVDDRGEALTLYTLTGVPKDAFAGFPMPRNTDLFGPTFRGEGVIRIDDVVRDPRYGRNAPYHGMPDGHLPVRSYLAVPVTSRSGEVLGGLFFGHPEPGRFTERDERIVAGIAGQAAIALDNARLYEAERTAREAAESANSAKDEFLSVLSHELRTPLTPIIGFTEMLRRKKQVSEATLSRALETIDRSAKAQSRLVADLLDVSRIITGKLTLDLQELELGPVVEAAVDAVRPDAQTKKLTIRTAIEAPGVLVIGDADRLQQVVWNLLSNAAKFTPPGGRVDVRVARDGDRATITVADTGCGITPGFLPHVFERFRQADGSSTRAHGGLGLGLAIVRHLVEMHGGQASATSAGEGRGATFVVRLPLSERPLLPVQGLDEGAGSAGGANPALLAGVRILVVEDDKDTRELLQIALTQDGAAVTAVASSAEALGALDISLPDIMLCDIGMPGEDGYSFISRVRARPAALGGRIPAVALTAYAGRDDRQRALRAGFQRHMAKPVDTDAVVATLAQLTGRTDAADRPASSPS